MSEASTQKPNGIQAKPLLYSDYSMLTVKNPTSKATKVDLLRVLYHLKDIVGFSNIKKKCFETGKQNQLHIHAIVKKKYPSEDLIKKYSKLYKTKKLKYYEEVPNDPLFDEPELIEQIIDTSKFNWYISEITDEAHLKRLEFEYLKKEGIVEFIDE